MTAPISEALENIFLYGQKSEISQLSHRSSIKRQKLSELPDQHATKQAFDDEAENFSATRVYLDITFAPSNKQMQYSEENDSQPVVLTPSTPDNDQRIYRILSLQHETLFDVQLPVGMSDAAATVIDTAAHHDLAWPRAKGAPRWGARSVIKYRGRSSLRVIIELQEANARSWPPENVHSESPMTGDVAMASRYKPWPGSPMMFYEAVHTPDPSIPIKFPILSGLDCDLYPFQKRAVTWMMKREGVGFLAEDSSLLMKRKYTSADDDPYHGFRHERDANRFRTCVNNLIETVRPAHKSLLDDTYASLKGGILAEEMGLGKTVELLALIIAHSEATSSRKSTSFNLQHDNVAIRDPSQSQAKNTSRQDHSTSYGWPLKAQLDPSGRVRRQSSPVVHSQFTKAPSISEEKKPPELEQCPATLVITPSAILEQWMKEIRSHTPNLKVLIYGGMGDFQKPLERLSRTSAERVDRINDSARAAFCSHDIVVTTYNVLSKEIHYTNETPDRATRSGDLLDRQRSTLVRLNWWRVILDEVQMIESGVSNAAKVARQIPRRNAWAVSGTPVRKDAEDLRGVLIFLGIEPYASSRKLWTQTVTQNPRLFQQIFHGIALRHAKASIRQEITLPPQKRVVVTMAFSRIEQQHYSQMFQQLCEQLGVDRYGQPLANPRVKDSISTELIMRGWLTRLRQVCLHPEIGDRNRAAFGRRKAPRTVHQVLEVMMEQNETALLAEERALLMSRIRRGQILEHAGDAQGALGIWEHSLAESAKLVRECRRQMSLLLGEAQESSTLGALDSIDYLEGCDRAEASRIGINLKEKGPLQFPVYRLRLRSVLELEHLCTFFVANAYYQIRLHSPQVETMASHELVKKEEAAYGRAKFLRKELLAESERKTGRWMDLVQSSMDDIMFIPDMKRELSLLGTSPKTKSICTRLVKLISELNFQTSLINHMQKDLRRLLCLSLVDQEDQQEIQGDEYETSTKQQDDIYTRVDVFRAVVADRREALTGQKNNLINRDMVKLLKDAKEGSGHSPELFLELETSRQLHKPASKLESIRGLLTELRDLKTSSAVSEAATALSLFDHVQELSKSQWKVSAALEKKSELFTDTMNARLDHYRQLQRISDTVAPFEVSYADSERENVLADMRGEESRIKAQAATLRSKARYLMHLKKEASANNVGQTRICVICQSDFQAGFLTSCGHTYCGDCWRMWWRSHRTCPACKSRLSTYDLHRIAEKSQELVAEEEIIPDGRVYSKVSKAGQDGIYVGVRTSVLNEIKTMEIPHRYGTKTDTLTRHILWLREHDPGAKSVIFSQYRDFLKVLRTVFMEANIGCATIEEKDGIARFKSEAGIECFFLHAQAQSSGLNLVEATHVFLCEPILNTAIELQAIARVHRIGQRLPTTVWMYIIDGTVEKAIYDVSIRRRLAHMSKDPVHSDPRKSPTSQNEGQDLSDVDLDVANSRELQETGTANLFTKGRNAAGDEVVAEKDLWQCLFSQPSEQTGHDAPEQDAVSDAFGEDGPLNVTFDARARRRSGDNPRSSTAQSGST